MKRRLIAIAFLLLMWGLPAFGQGCAMCYASAEAAGQKAQAALRRGIIMLLVPTLGVFGGMGGALVYFRRPRGGYDDEGTAEEPLAEPPANEQEKEEEELVEV